MDGDGLVRVELPKNRTGLWVAALKLETSGLSLVSMERFDVYKDTSSETSALVKFVDALPVGAVVLVSITDTAVAKTRPLSRALYDALGALGAALTMEPLGDFSSSLNYH